MLKAEKVEFEGITVNVSKCTGLLSEISVWQLYGTATKKQAASTYGMSLWIEE